MQCHFIVIELKKKTRHFSCKDVACLTPLIHRAADTEEHMHC